MGAGIGAVPATESVEQWLAATWAPRRALRTDSGTSALRLAIEAAVVVTGESRVAAPAYVCYDVATALDGARAVPVLYDLDPATLGPDCVSLRRALERGARTIVAVHLYGIPVDLVAIRLLAAEYGALIIEDAAQAIGASVGGRPSGALGDLGVLSFGRGKGVTGGGGGALLVFDDRADAKVARELPASRGTLKARVALVAQAVLARPGLFWIPALVPGTGLGETVYHEFWPPARQSEFSARVLSATIALSKPELRSRVAHADLFRQWISGHPRLAGIVPLAGGAPSWLRFPVVAVSGRAAPYDSSGRRLGVMPGYPLSLADLPGFRERVANASDPFPGARVLAKGLGTLPTHSLLSSADLARIKGWLEGLR